MLRNTCMGDSPTYSNTKSLLWTLGNTKKSLTYNNTQESPMTFPGINLYSYIPIKDKNT